jgi:dethiobiotin synthetase
MTEIPGLLVVGTDTGVGKTRVASAIARAMTDAGRSVGVLKPVATGATAIEGGWQVDDADRLIEAIGGGVPMAEVCPIAFAEPLAPTVAARRSGTPLEAGVVERAAMAAIERWRSTRGAEVMIVEGVGGLLCPLAEGMTVADLAVRLDYPLIVVARRGLGTLNHTLLTIEAALHRALRVAGVVLNGAEPTVDPVAEATNPDELARWLGAIPILGDWPHETAGTDRPSLRPSGSPTDASGSVVMDGLDWYNRAERPRLAHPSALI